MTGGAADKIFINGLRVECVIGTRPEEREFSQGLVIDLELSLDLSAAGRSDDLDRSVNYAELERKVVELAENNRAFLLESLAENIADETLRRPLVEAVKVRIRKKLASAFGADIGVEIVRKRAAS